MTQIANTKREPENWREEKKYDIKDTREVNRRRANKTETSRETYDDERVNAEREKREKRRKKFN